MRRQLVTRRFGPVLVLAGMAATLSAPARALDCDNATDQASLNYCAGRAYNEADNRLNDLYRVLKERLRAEPNRLARLVSAQRAWIGFRDLECAFAASSVEGGSAHSMANADCLRARTEQRIEALKAYESCEEGDMTCPVPPAPPSAN